MDKLSDIPVQNNTQHTPQEDAVMKQFFPDSSGEPPHTPPQHYEDESNYKEGYEYEKPKGGKVNWKLIGYAAIIFALLANPWADDAVSKVPYGGDNAMMRLVVKVLMFVLLLTLVSMFLV